MLVTPLRTHLCVSSGEARNANFTIAPTRDEIHNLQHSGKACYQFLITIFFFKSQDTVYTRAVRKVRGQVPIFLKNNLFFKNVSDTFIL